VSVRTTNGHYDSIVDVDMANCEGGGQRGGSHAGGGGSGAAGLQDLVGARAAGGESELQRSGYNFVSSSNSGGSSYANWSNGRHCVAVRTTGGHYKSIVDTPMADCN
jgi:hypothetical protein